MEELGYTNYYQVLDAKDYGIPQHREREYLQSASTINVMKYLNFQLVKH